mmetsp:Transcript_47661/g.102020  ORF Transcript_47661/g.102020 Transcript_47661/m.102020 type:complete len:236 (+) Transcript_47661:1159-1866(+)
MGETTGCCPGCWCCRSSCPPCGRMGETRRCCCCRPCCCTSKGCCPCCCPGNCNRSRCRSGCCCPSWGAAIEAAACSSSSSSPTSGRKRALNSRVPPLAVPPPRPGESGSGVENGSCAGVQTEARREREGDATIRSDAWEQMLARREAVRAAVSGAQALLMFFTLVGLTSSSSPSGLHAPLASSAGPSVMRRRRSKTSASSGEAIRNRGSEAEAIGPRSRGRAGAEPPPAWAAKAA